MNDLFHKLLIHLYQNNALSLELDVTDFIKEVIGSDYNSRDSLFLIRDQLTQLNGSGYTNAFHVPPLGHTTNNIFHTLDTDKIKIKLVKEGWLYIKKQITEDKEFSLLESQANSIIETNNSIKNTNTSVKKLNDEILPKNFSDQNRNAKMSLLLAGFSVLFIGVTAWMQYQDKTPQRVEELKQEVQETKKTLESLRISLARIADSIGSLKKGVFVENPKK